MTDARNEILRWADRGHLPRARVPAALIAGGAVPSGPQWRDFLERLCTWLGAALLAAACAFFVAANWAALGRYGKFALVEAALVVALALAWWRQLDTLAGRAALFAAALLTGVLLALVGQVYQTGADAWELFAAWAAAIALWVAVGRQPALWILWLAIVEAAVILYFRTRIPFVSGLLGFVLATPEALAVVFAANVAALATWEWCAVRRGGWCAVRWAPRVVATAGGVAVTLLVLHEVVEGGRYTLPPWLAYGAWTAAMLHVYWKWRFDLFMLCGALGSLIVVIAFVAARPLLGHGGAASYLLVGLLLVACAAAASLWLRHVAGRAPR